MQKVLTLIFSIMVVLTIIKNSVFEPGMLKPFRDCRLRSNRISHSLATISVPKKFVKIFLLFMKESTLVLASHQNSSSSRSRFLGQINDPNAELITYVSRGFEEYRGFPQAMHTFARLQAIRPHVHVLIAGSDVVAYGNNRSDGKSWKEWALTDVGLDPGRTHWLGALQENAYHHLLASSDVHFYLTVPFVLSWSLLEAMAAGCSIVSSYTASSKCLGNEHRLLFSSTSLMFHLRLPLSIVYWRTGPS